MIIKIIITNNNNNNNNIIIINILEYKLKDKPSNRDKLDKLDIILNNIS